MTMKWWSRLMKGGDRGMVEVGVAAGGALLVIGALAGNGVAATVVNMSDGQAWLPGQDGRIVQVNPATGIPERKLVVGADGSRLAIAQHDGDLIVTDESTGTLTSVDLSALVASGSRTATGSQRVLVGGGRVVLVDSDPGTVRAVDPLTLADLGRPFRTRGKIADAAVDGDGDVWVLTDDGRLTQLGYSTTTDSFHTEQNRAVTGAGAQSRLVPHAKGVTVFASDGGAVVQVGSGTDVAVTVPDLTGAVDAAPWSPATLVPASATDAGRVFLLSDRDVLQVDVAGLGCDRPGTPQVFDQRVYVPCLGKGRIMVLNGHGKRVGADIVVPGGGDPQFTADEGRLFVTTANDGRTVVVQPDGSTGVVDLGQKPVPETNVDAPPPVTIPAPATPADPTPANPPADDRHDGASPSPQPGADPLPPATAPPGQGDPGSAAPGTPTTGLGGTGTPTGGPGGTSGGDPGTPTTAPPAGHAAAAVTNVQASLAGTTVTVTWSPAASGADEYLVQPSGGSWTSAGTATTLTFPGVGFGSHTFVVQTQLGSSTADSAPSNAVTIAGAPGAPGQPRVTGLSGDGHAVDFSASWAASAANGAPVTYTVAMVGAGRQKTVTTTATALSDTLVCNPGKEFLCGASQNGEPSTISVTVTVTPANSAGTGPAATGSASAQVGAVAPPAPKNGDAVVSGIRFPKPGVYEDNMPYQVNVAPPASWSSFTGTCTLHITGDVTGPQARAIPCDSTGAVGGGETRSGGTVSAYVVAEGAATSSTASGQADNRNAYEHCSRTSPQICTQPVSFRTGDPTVTVIPAVWAPPQVPNPPVLVAGVVMIGGAGLLRGLRRTGRRGRGRRPGRDAASTPGASSNGDPA